MSRQCPRGQESPHNPGYFYTGEVSSNGGCVTRLGYSATDMIANNMMIGEPVTNVKPVSTATQSKTKGLGLMPYRFEPDNGYRPSNITLTQGYRPALSIVSEEENKKTVAGCGCTAANGSACTCTKKKIISLAIGLGFVAVLIGLAYGVSKLMPD